MTSQVIIDKIEEAQDKYLPDVTAEGGGGFGFDITSMLVSTGDSLPQWPKAARDRRLFELLIENGHLAGLAYTAMTKLANIPLKFVPADPTIIAHVNYARQFQKITSIVSGGGKGIRGELKKYILDYLISDNGGFLEIMGDGPVTGPIQGAPWGLIHRDTLQCRRTKDPEFPVIYIDPDRKQTRYKVHYSRIISMAQMPLGRATASGKGFGSISRSHMLGEVLTGQIRYKLEKMGTRPATKLFVGSGMDANKMMAAFFVAKQMQDNAQLQNYGMNVYIGGDQGTSVNAFDLNNFEPFNEEVGTEMAMYALAYIWGLKVQEIWPIAGNKSSEEVANLQSRGRLPADFTNDLAEQLDAKFVPPFLETKFDIVDDAQDHDRAIIKDIKTRSTARLAEYEIIDNASQRRRMFEDGDLGRAEFIRQQHDDGFLEDGAPIGSLFYSNDELILALLSLDGFLYPMVYEDNDADGIIRQIHINIDYCYQVIGMVRSEPQRRKARAALAALEWLKKQYEGIAIGQDEPDEPDEPEEEAEEEAEEIEEG